MERPCAESLLKGRSTRAVGGVCSNYQIKRKKLNEKRVRTFAQQALSTATMAQRDGKKKKKLTKQAIIDLLDENEIDLSMSDLTTATLPVKELVQN